MCTHMTSANSVNLFLHDQQGNAVDGGLQRFDKPTLHRRSLRVLFILVDITRDILIVI